jgi:acetyl esterase/lipase
MSYTVHEDGSVELGGRIVPVPTTVSAAAQGQLRAAATRPAPADTPLWERRDQIDRVMHGLNHIARARYAVTVEELDIGGVGCHAVRPVNTAAPGKVLVNLHAGGFVIGSGTLVEAVPIAARTGATVIAVDYRLAPEHAYPAAIDDILTVYRRVLDHHSPADVGIFGTSAGGFLTGQALTHMRRDGVPFPAVAGIFSAGGDFGALGDTAAIFNMGGFTGDRIHPIDHPHSDIAKYLAGADPTDPLISPALGDLTGFPPTILVSGTRDATLSCTALMHRALRRHGVTAELYVFEAMAHGFWYNLELPETMEAIDAMASFFKQHLHIAH